MVKKDAKAQTVQKIGSKINKPAITVAAIKQINGVMPKSKSKTQTNVAQDINKNECMCV